jgi:adenine-specific DNA-methyltransferase
LTHITREPEQVKAFRDTWRDGIHSYLTYLRDRLTVARDLLTESGSIFVQIGDENVHRVRALMDEVFGDENFVSKIIFRKTTGKASGTLDNTCDFLLWYCKVRSSLKFRAGFDERTHIDDQNIRFVQDASFARRGMDAAESMGAKPLPPGSKAFRYNPLTSARTPQPNDVPSFTHSGVSYDPGNRTFSTNLNGLVRLQKAGRLYGIGRSLTYIRFVDDFPFKPQTDIWDDTRQSGFGDQKIYVVQTALRAIERCILMTTDPGDLVLDPTCGSGTTAFVAEQWGRRWITIDTSRVALALARARITGARYPYYLLADSPEGQRKEAEVTRSVPRSAPTRGDIRQGFVYERVPHVTLKSIANNAEIDVIWERFQEVLEPLRVELNAALGEAWEDWEIPREAGKDWPARAEQAHEAWWEQRIARQKEIDASIAAKADTEYLHDKPYADPGRVRVAGPFTVESLSPHRTLAFDENDELHEPNSVHESGPGAWIGEGVAIDRRDFAAVIMEQLRSAGVQYAHKEAHIRFSSLTGWPGEMICAEGRYQDNEDGPLKRAGVLIGPEFGTVAREDLVKAAREAGDAGFDVVIACAFNFDAHASDFEKLGKVPVIKARMNPDLHMADELKESRGGNLFVVFGEPDIEIRQRDDGLIEVELKGVDVFHPTRGEVVSSGPDEIAIWFIDTDYNEESFFVRHAYFPGTAHDPMKALKTTLKAEIDAEAWASLNRTVSRPFVKPKTGRIAVKVINHLGDEVMKVFGVR